VVASDDRFSKRPYQLISACNCQKERWEEFLICTHAKRWLTLIEIKTDVRIDYKHCVEVYERVQLKTGNNDEEVQISRDTHRTFPEEPFFSKKHGEG
jgi:hypothetical protein